MFTSILIPVLALAGINGALALVLVFAEHFFANYGECEITINDGTKELTVKGGASLLAALNTQKVFLPAACGGRGTCAYCKCRVTAGAGPLLPTEEPHLDKEEIAERIRLACQVKVKEDVVIEIPEELFNIKEFEAEVASIKDLTHDIKMVRLNLIDPPAIRFKSGQYVQLQSKPYEDVKDSVSRAYSVSSPSYETNYIELMIRLVPHGICTSWVFSHLSEGERVKFVGPVGDFRLHEGTGEAVVVAGGCGMAPMASILRDVAKQKIDRKITYFFGAVTRKDLFYMDEMKTLENELPNFTFIPALSHPTPEDDWHGETGLITVPLENHLKEIETADVQAFLCGSPGMIDACISVFNKHGVSNDRIFYDPFA